ncbi:MULTISPECIES: large-conductance mechanosensitive channel protein MscL [Salegentibacter]|uniref:Large-conductance mechanosensitive channel n=1 Tax=Salegentibacter maritimus TaxID=2794347 RepID=A0ABS0TH30_9FLAO|nr:MULTISPECIES: large-conductance mechanosensitive channel protein MscL [Salegentibacter]MBE7641250.1 large-conductance mechanosensitive channel protein MscL [Salegentibacter sp. BLCTC]MBI6117448.1 large-conductance mechanosensitive channel protein MscL [Salegentibacter maritimus]MBI6120364.1 large-conductance mechanosensitive channel protein MscL [Salegentibacter maritimus]
MSFFKDFKKFILKGDIIALATAVVIGAAFNKIVASVVADVIMPIIGLITGGTDFSQKFISLDGASYNSLEAAKEAEAAVITYGNLIDTIIHFLIVAFFIFLVLRAYEKTKKEKEAPKLVEPKGPTQEDLLTQIRDELKKQNSRT